MMITLELLRRDQWEYHFKYFLPSQALAAQQQAEYLFGIPARLVRPK